MDTKEFVLAGNCRFTLRHGVNNKSYTYKTEQSHEDPHVLFVYHVKGDTLEYMGLWCTDTSVFLPISKYVDYSPYARPAHYRAIEYLVRTFGNVPEHTSIEEA